MSNELMRIENEDEFSLELKKLKGFQKKIRSLLVEDEDFGSITLGGKPTLYKSGAEILAEAYKMYPEYEILQTLEKWNEDAPFFYYQIKCVLKSKETDMPVGTGMGSANSKEIKWRWRWIYEKDVPANIDINSLSKKNNKSKNGGTFITYKIENNEIYTEVNTILKIAKKRAFVDAVLSTTRSSAIFTQDIEDLSNEKEEEKIPVAIENKEEKKEAVKAEFENKEIVHKTEWTVKEILLINEIKEKMGDKNYLYNGFCVINKISKGLKVPDLSIEQLDKLNLYIDDSLHKTEVKE